MVMAIADVLEEAADEEVILHFSAKNADTIPFPGRSKPGTRKVSYQTHRPALHAKGKKSLFLPVALRVFLSQVIAVGPFVGLNIHETPIFIPYRIHFFTTAAAVGCSFNWHNV